MSIFENLGMSVNNQLTAEDSLSRIMNLLLNFQCQNTELIFLLVASWAKYVLLWPQHLFC